MWVMSCWSECVVLFRRTIEIRGGEFHSLDLSIEEARHEQRGCVMNFGMKTVVAVRKDPAGLLR